MLCFLTSPQNVDPRQQLLSHRVQVCGLGHSGSAKRSAVILKLHNGDKKDTMQRWCFEDQSRDSFQKRQQQAALTCGAEQEGGGLSQVPVHCVGDVYLGVGEGAEGLFVGRTHLRLDVVEQQREGAAAKLLHLRPEKGRAAEKG